MGLITVDLSEARAKLMQERKQLRPRASYLDAARVNRTYSDFTWQILSANQIVGLDLERVVGRSRQLATSDTTYAKFLAAVWKNVFGPDGIRLQSRVTMLRGGKLDTQANAVIEQGWKEWSKRQNCTLDQRLNLIHLQKLVSRTVVVDGECFIRKVVAPWNPFAFSLQIINSDRVDRNYGRNVPLVLPNKNVVFMGVECSAQTGRVAAYHIFDQHPSEHSSSPQQRRRVPADEIIHLFLPIFDGQWRGLPWALPSMLRMHGLSEYMKAELVGARVGASALGFFTQTIDPDAPYPANQNPEAVDERGGQDWNLDPGSINYAPPGFDFKTFDPQHPTSQFSAYVKECKMDIAAGLDAAYMTVSGDVSAANYSSARVGLLDERATWQGLQGYYIEELMQPIFEAWLKTSFLAYPVFRVWFNAANWADYNHPEFQPKAFDWVDPQKDAEAIKTKLSAAQTTLTRELGAQGWGFDETIDELAREFKALKDKGLPDWFVQLAFGGPAAKVTETKPTTGAPANQTNAATAQEHSQYLMSLRK